jgi:signal transduction histidine kinase
MMDVPIRLRGKVLGIVCHEHIGAMRHWLPEEQQFVADIADMVSLALESSERKRAEEELKQANEDLQRLSQLKSQFALMVSHELRTPLTVIKEAIGIVSDGIDGPVTEGQKETLGMARDNVDRLARLINNVLDYERLESGKMKMVFEKTNINQLINDVHQFMQMVAKKKNIQLLLALPEAPLFATCDSDKLREVMINLIDNGLKFTPSGGKITIRLSQLNNQVKIEVEDTGMGIKKEEQDKIYEMFSRGSGHLALKIGGFGVGLAVCKLIVIQHQGEISVESMPGKGTTFHLLIPIEQT